MFFQKKKIEKQNPELFCSFFFSYHNNDLSELWCEYVDALVRLLRVEDYPKVRWENDEQVIAYEQHESYE